MSTPCLWLPLVLPPPPPPPPPPQLFPQPWDDEAAVLDDDVDETELELTELEELDEDMTLEELELEDTSLLDELELEELTSEELELDELELDGVEELDEDELMTCQFWNVTRAHWLPVPTVTVPFAGKTANCLQVLGSTSVTVCTPTGTPVYCVYPLPSLRFSVKSSSLKVN